MADLPGALTQTGSGGSWSQYQAVNVPGSDGGGGGGGFASAMGDAALAVADTAMANIPGASLAAGAAGLFASNLQSAKLEVYEAPLDKDSTEVKAQIATIEFKLNPHTITYSKSVGWQSTGAGKAQSSQLAQFGKAEPAQMAFDVMFDTSFELDRGKAAVVSPVNALLACCIPTMTSVDKDMPMPPWVRLHWGQATYPYMIMKSVGVTYPVFSADGIPLRAVCKLSLQEVFSAKGATNPTSGALTAKGSHPVIEGDSLPSISYRHYGNANLWRRIAEANDIDDPSRLAVGSTLFVPSLSERRG
jgi:nucleoid-associated protein YgaU